MLTGCAPGNPELQQLPHTSKLIVITVTHCIWVQFYRDSKSHCYSKSHCFLSASNKWIFL